MPAWLPFADYARLKRLERGGVEALEFPETPEPEVKVYANRLRGLIASWRPPHHWSVRVSGRRIVVHKLEPWRLPY